MLRLRLVDFRYDLECTHSGYTWQVVRKYNSFEELHRALRFYRAALIISRTAAAGSGPTPVLKGDEEKKKSKQTPPVRARYALP